LRKSALPAVVEAGHALGIADRAIEMERQDDTLAIGRGLVEHRSPAAQQQGARIAKPAHAAHGPVVMIERAVFLHQDNHMLDIPDRARAAIGRKAERAGNGRRHRAGCRRASHGLKKSATRRQVLHACFRNKKTFKPPLWRASFKA
jgi:hypothetical protein